MDCFVAALLAMTVYLGPAGREKTMKQPCVYIFASGRRGTRYTGVTSNLPKRAFEHREGLAKGFSLKYGCKIMVWYELHGTMIEAITREKQIKAGSRAKKLALIEALNPSLDEKKGWITSSLRSSQ
jgi:putative endonuclease